MGSIEAHYGKPALTIPANATVSEAAKVMTERRIGALVVTDAGSPVGLVSERDLVAKVLVPCLDACAVLVSDVMLREVVFVSPREDPARCSELMKLGGSRTLVVRDGDHLLGVVSMRDVIRALLDERESEVRQLTEYVTGSNA